MRKGGGPISRVLYPKGMATIYLALPTRQGIGITG